jgi:hypothetical protein
MELVFNIFLAAFLIVFYAVSLSFGGMTISTDQIGPGGFPQIVIILSLIFLLINTVDLLKNKKNTKKTKFDFHDKGFKIMIIGIALFALYIVLLNLLGFMLSTFIFSSVTIWMLGYREKLKGLAFTLILTISITLVFGKFFFVSLPRGIWILRELSYLIY